MSRWQHKTDFGVITIVLSYTRAQQGIHSLNECPCTTQEGIVSCDVDLHWVLRGYAKCPMTKAEILRAQQDHRQHPHSMSLRNILALVIDACGLHCTQSVHRMLGTTHTSLQQSILVILLCILLVFAPQLLAFCGHQVTPFPQPTDQALSMPAYKLKGMCCRIHYLEKWTSPNFDVMSSTERCAYDLNKAVAVTCYRAKTIT